MCDFKYINFNWDVVIFDILLYWNFNILVFGGGERKRWRGWRRRSGEEREVEELGGRGKKEMVEGFLFWVERIYGGWERKWEIGNWDLERERGRWWWNLVCDWFILWKWRFERGWKWKWRVLFLRGNEIWESGVKIFYKFYEDLFFKGVWFIKQGSGGWVTNILLRLTRGFEFEF